MKYSVTLQPSSLATTVIYKIIFKPQYHSGMLMSHSLDGREMSNLRLLQLQKPGPLK
jgi:hypothetical protein